MIDREKLIELIREVEHTCRQVECWDCKTYVLEDGNCQAEAIANHLISKGVTIPVRCGECCYYNENGICCCPNAVQSFYGCKVKETHFCSYGERREDERN